MATSNEWRESEHIPVLKEGVVSWLQKGRRFIDVTLGGGGHAEALLSSISGSELIGIDRDHEALERAKKRLSLFEGRATFLCGTFRTFSQASSARGWEGVDGVIADLGVSSFHLDEAHRGFSFRKEGPLDMRMDTQEGMTAAAWLASASEEEMAHIFRHFGEERFAARIAAHLATRRNERPFNTTLDLAEEITRAVPGRFRHGRLHPATRVFQAIRIHLNDELGELQSLLDQVPGLLAPQGRMLVISYHSLEDRMVKQAFRARAQSAEYSLPIRRVIRPDEVEVEKNPRARSAKMRILEREAA